MSIVKKVESGNIANFKKIIKNIENMVQKICDIHNIKKYGIYKGLKQNSYSYTSFLNKVNFLGFSDIDVFLDQRENWIIAYHGTPEIRSAYNICANSWNMNLSGLHGNDHGSGIYFTDNVETAKKYAIRGNNIGAVIITIIINCDLFKVNMKKIRKPNNETWYLTSSPDICFPIGFILL